MSAMSGTSASAPIRSGYKRSGFGRKGDFTASMREFVQVKGVHMDLTDDRTRSLNYAVTSSLPSVSGIV